MYTYIVLLKGINVGGHHKIKMADLKLQLQNTGVISDVQSYIQSGNLVVNSSLQMLQLVETIETCIEENYGFKIPVLTFLKSEWLSISETHPYLKEAEDIKTLHVTFLFNSPQPDVWQEILTFKPNNEHCKRIDKSLYLFYPDGFGRSKFHSALIERKLKCHTTSRNWRTIQKLRSMLLDSET